VAFAYVDRRLPQSRFVTGRKTMWTSSTSLSISLFMS
jgi:hypothetical protein